MKCEKMPELLVSYLYNELEPDQIESVRDHLDTCRSCAEIYEELKESSSLLSRWPDEAPNTNFRFIQTRSSIKSALTSWLRHKTTGQKILVGVPAFACGLLLFLSALNFHAEKDNEGWKVSFSLLPGGTPTKQEELLDTIEAHNRHTLELVAEMIAESEQRQYVLTRNNMATMAKQIQDQRNQDLRMVGYGLEGIKETTEGKLQRTNRIIDDLAKLAGYRLDHK